MGWPSNGDSNLALPLSYDDLPADIDDSKKIKSVRRAGLAQPF